MRHYGTVCPQFWTGRTGRKIRDMAKASVIGPDVQRVALYLMTSPHANMIGLYFLPTLYLCEEVGIKEPEATRALAELRRLDFSFYDQESEHIWVKEMARFQVGTQLHEKDGNVGAIRKLYQNLPANPFLGLFFDRYASDFRLTTKREPHGTTPEGGALGGALTPPIRIGSDRVGSLSSSSSSSSDSDSDGEGSKGGGLVVLDETKATPEWVIDNWNAIVGFEPFAMKYYHQHAGVGKKLGIRVREHPHKVWWEGYFARLQASNWLVEEFHPVLDWGVGPKNIQKVLQGNYIKTVASKPKTAFGQLMNDLHQATTEETREVFTVHMGGEE